MLPSPHYKSTENTKTADRNKHFLQSINLQMRQNQNDDPPNSNSDAERELKLDQEFMNFISVRSKSRPPASQISTDTLRLLGVFDTKPIVSCIADDKETSNKKVTFDNFKIKVS